jgi:hypothetical protein
LRFAGLIIVRGALGYAVLRTKEHKQTCNSEQVALFHSNSVLRSTKNKKAAVRRGSPQDPLHPTAVKRLFPIFLGTLRARCILSSLEKGGSPTSSKRPRTRTGPEVHREPPLLPISRAHLQELHCKPSGLVGLSQSCHTRLLQNGCLRKVCCLCSHVRISDSAVRCRQVLAIS